MNCGLKHFGWILELRKVQFWVLKHTFDVIVWSILELIVTICVLKNFLVFWVPWDL